MRVQTKTVTVVRLEATEAEWAVLRGLVAEGLSVVAAVTPDMARVAEGLGLQVQDPADAPAAVPPPAPPDRPPRRRKGG